MRRWLALILLGGGVAWAAPGKPVVKVAADGSAQYRTVQSAVDAAGDGGEVIEIAPGTYHEKILIARDGIELRGEGRRPEDTVLTFDDSAGTAGGTKNSYSVGVTGNDFRAENLTIANDFEAHHPRTGGEGWQAVALMINGDREVLRHVRLLGFQDTLYANSKTCHNSSDPADKECHASRMLFQDCYIEGHVDFIFGDAKAVFDHCELHGLKSPNVMLTAQSRLYPLEDSGYLFLDCTVTADPGVGKLILGRPWRPYARVYFVNTRIKGATVDPEGWSEWADKLKTSDYAEFNTGPGADVSKRIAPSRQLTRAEAAKLTVKSWLAGADGWDPAK